MRRRGSIRKPHSRTASKRVRIEACAPIYLKNVVVIMMEMGLRPYLELLPMRRERVDSEYLFPSPWAGRKPLLTTLEKARTATLERARLPYFTILGAAAHVRDAASAGGVTDHFVSQLLRQDD